MATHIHIHDNAGVTDTEDYGTSEGARKRAMHSGPNTSALEAAAAERKRLNETKYKNVSTKPMQNTSQYFFKPGSGLPPAAPWPKSREPRSSAEETRMRGKRSFWK